MNKKFIKRTSVFILIVILLSVTAFTVSCLPSKKEKIKEQLHNCMKYIIYPEEVALTGSKAGSPLSEDLKICENLLKKFEEKSPITVKYIPANNLMDKPVFAIDSIVLHNGKVLLYRNTDNSIEAQLFDPATKTFSNIPIGNQINTNNLYSYLYDFIHIDNDKLLIKNVIYNIKTNKFENPDKTLERILKDYCRQDITSKMVYLGPEGQILKLTNCDSDGCQGILSLNPLKKEKTCEGKLHIKRHSIYPVKLNDGKYLITGYYNSGKNINNQDIECKTIEIYDPKTGQIELIGKTKEPVFPGFIDILDNGTVMFWECITHKCSNHIVEVYDPKTNLIKLNDTPLNLMGLNKLLVLPESKNILILGEYGALLYNLQEKKYYRLKNKIFKYDISDASFRRLFIPLDNKNILVIGKFLNDKEKQYGTNQAAIITLKDNYKNYLYSFDDDGDYFMNTIKELE